MRLAGFAASTAVAIATLTVPAGQAAAASGSACSPAAADRCVSATVRTLQPGTTTTESRAAAPYDLLVSADNTSAQRSSDPATWWRTIKVTLADGLGSRAYTRSRDLPDGLLVGGAVGDCGSGLDFSSCTAGYGVLDANVSGTGAIDGVRTGTFGIQRIVNDSTPGSTNDVLWRATVHFCLDVEGVCNDGTPAEAVIALKVAKPAQGRSGSLAIPTDVAFGFPYGDAATATVDGALNTISAFRVNARSNRLANGTLLSHSAVLLRLPITCGAGSFALRAADRDNVLVSLALHQKLGGCPTAAFTGTGIWVAKVVFDANDAAASGARTITRFHWKFGDGRTKTTSHAQVTHPYGDSRDRKVTLVVEDSFGAVSSPRTVLMRGSALTVNPSSSSVADGTPVTLRGRLKRWHSTTVLGGRYLRVLECNSTTGRCVRVAQTHTSARGTYEARVVAHKIMVYVVQFKGETRYIGSVAQTNLLVPWSVT